MLSAGDPHETLELWVLHFQVGLLECWQMEEHEGQKVRDYPGNGWEGCSGGQRKEAEVKVVVGGQRGKDKRCIFVLYL